MKKTAAKKGNPELIEALNAIEKEKDISKEILLEAIENSLVAACKNEYGKADNIRVNLDRETGEFHVYQDKVVVEEVEDAMLEMSQTEAEVKYPGTGLGETVSIEVTPKNFGRIAAQKAKQVVVQKIREEERKVLFEQYYEKEHDIVTGMVQRYNNGNYNVNIGKIDAVLTKQEQVPSEHFEAHDRIKLYVTEVKDTPRGPRIVISRTHPELVKRLFESEVTEVKDGTVEIKSIAREAGSRTKMAVWSNNPDVDPVGACVGMKLGLTLEEIQTGISSLKTIAGRTNLIDTGSLLIIDDCYNANPVSMKSSLDVLSTATGRTVAVMGDMYELGDKENELHYNTGTHAAEIGIDVICCIGELSHHAYEGAKACAKSSAVLYFKTKQDFLGKIRNVVKKDDTILVKASHGMEFPEIIDVLRQMKF